MSDYRATVEFIVNVEASSAGRAQEQIAEEVAGMFSTMGNVEVVETSIRVMEPNNGSPFIAGPPPIPDEMMELNRRMVEALERSHPPKKDWEGDAGGAS